MHAEIEFTHDMHGMLLRRRVHGACLRPLSRVSDDLSELFASEGMQGSPGNDVSRTNIEAATLACGIEHHFQEPGLSLLSDAFDGRRMLPSTFHSRLRGVILLVFELYVQEEYQQSSSDGTEYRPCDENSSLWTCSFCTSECGSLGTVPLLEARLVLVDDSGAVHIE
jgi:hypothetical protein